MPLVLRKIRKARWYRLEGVSWLAEGDVHADPLADLPTSENRLSVWHVEDDRSNLERVVAALAASCGAVSNLDYALLDQQVLSTTLKVKIEGNRGASPDDKANESWHRDLVELSASKLVELAKAFLANGERDRVPEKKVRRLLADAVASGNVDSRRVDARIRADIDKHRTHEL